MAAKMYRSAGAVATGSDRPMRPIRPMRPMRPMRKTATKGRPGGEAARRSVREPGLLGDLGGEVVLLLLEALAELEPHEPADLDVLADLGDQLLLDLVDRLLAVQVQQELI